MTAETLARWSRKAGTDAVDVEYTDVEETAEDSDEGNSEK